MTTTLFKKEVSFTASIGDEPCPYANVSHMRIGLLGAQTGTTAPTLATIVQKLSEIQYIDTEAMFQGNSIDGEDLLAISCMFVGATPEIIIPAGDTQTLSVGNIVVPLNSGGTALGVTPSTHFLRGTVATWTSEKLTVELEHDVAIGEKYRYVKKTDTAETTGASTDMSVTGKKLKALLVYATTIPSTTNNQRSVQFLEFLVGGSKKYEFSWLTMGKGRYTGNAKDDTTLGTVLDNFRIVTFPQGLDANNLTVVAYSDTATDTIEYIGIYQ